MRVLLIPTTDRTLAKIRIRSEKGLAHCLGCEVGDCRESVANPLATRSTYGYTLGMKTAVSIPNDLFEGAERLARRTRRSRSRLFSDALREYLARHTPDNVTELMDKALGQIGAGKDTFVSSAGKRTLYEIEW